MLIDLNHTSNTVDSTCRLQFGGAGIAQKNCISLQKEIKKLFNWCRDFFSILRKRLKGLSPCFDVRHLTANRLIYLIKSIQYAEALTFFFFLNVTFGSTLEEKR